MLPLGHMGITLFIVKIVTWFLGLKSIDYRVLLLGSILPDLIDKPLGLLVSPNHIFAKSFGHSLLFLVVLYSLSLLLRNNHHKTTIRIFCVGSMMHDIFDLMWHFPEVLFCPLELLVFPKVPYEPWGQIIYFNGLSIRQVFAIEVLGGLMLFFLYVINRKKL